MKSGAIMRLANLVLAWLLLGLAAPALAAPVRGEIVRSSVQVGRVTVPLPTGDWIVVADQTGTTAIDGMPSGPSWKGVYLVQQDSDHRFVASFYIRTSTSSAVVGAWLDTLCNRRDTLYRDTLDATVKAPNCLLINHITRYQQAVPSASLDKEVWEWLQRERVRLPQTALQVQTRFFRFGDFLYVNYTINPELAGFEPSTISEWASSEWHPVKVKNDPRRLEYVERLKSYALQAAAMHQAALRGEAAPGRDLGAIPR